MSETFIYPPYYVPLQQVAAGCRKMETENNKKWIIVDEQDYGDSDRLFNTYRDARDYASTMYDLSDMVANKLITRVYTGHGRECIYQVAGQETYIMRVKTAIRMGWVSQ